MKRRIAAILMAIALVGMSQAALAEEQGTAPVQQQEQAAPLAVQEAQETAVNTHTFVFLSEGQEADRVILKGEETLHRPATPASQSGDVFIGWFTEDGEEYTAFDAAPAMDNSTTTLTARFEARKLAVRFHDGNGRVVLTETVEAGETYTVYPDAPILDVDPTHRNLGWKDAQGNPKEGDLVIEDDLDLYPNLESGFWVRFDTDGGKKIDSQFVHGGESATRPEDPDKVGYAFDGWYTQAGGAGEAYDFDSTVTAPMTLHAKWKPAQVTYQVFVWNENANNDDYSLASKIVQTGYTGDKAIYEFSAAQMPLNLGGTATNANIYNPEKTGLTAQLEGSLYRVTGGEILPDGSTVLNVYFRKKLVNITFTGNYLKGLCPDGLSNAKYNSSWWTGLGITQSSWSNAGRRLMVRYNGQQVIDAWTGQLATSWDNPGRYPDGASLVIDDRTNNGNYLFTYIWQCQTLAMEDVNLDSSYAEFQRNAFRTSSNNVNGYTKTLTGFTWRATTGQSRVVTYGSTQYVESAIESEQDKTMRPVTYWFTRNTYQLTFNTHATGAPEPQLNVGADYSKVPYQMPLDGSFDDRGSYAPSNYIPGETSMMSEGVRYIFQGWCSDYECTTMVDVDALTMPARNLMLFAKWEREKVTLTFDPANGEDPITHEVHYHDFARDYQPDDPVKEGSTFLAWTVDGRPYDFHSHLTGDLTLTAAYSNSKLVKVLYDVEGDFLQVVDPFLYYAGTDAAVLDAAGVTLPAGKTFAFWKAAEQQVLPGRLISLNLGEAWMEEREDPDLGTSYLVRLKAVLGTPFEKAALTYDLNYDSYGITPPVDEQRQTEEVLNNSTVELRGIADEEIPRGYTFGGWYAERDASGSPLESRFVARENDNTVYARWVPIVYTITYDPNGGVFRESEAPTSEQWPFGETIAIAEAPTREGYTFLYWKGSEYQPGDKYTVEGDHTFVAQWQENVVPDEPVDEPVDEPGDEPGDGDQPGGGDQGDKPGDKPADEPGGQDDGSAGDKADDATPSEAPQKPSSPARQSTPAAAVPVTGDESPLLLGLLLAIAGGTLVLVSHKSPGYIR